MSGRRQGNPRASWTPKFVNLRHPQGSRTGVYGSHSDLVEATIYSGNDNNELPNQFNRAYGTNTNYAGQRPNQPGGARFQRNDNRRLQNRESNPNHASDRRNRASSANPNQSYQTRNFTDSQNDYQNRRGGNGNNFQTRGHQNYDNRRATPRGSNDFPSSSQPRGRRPIGFKALESLLEKDPEELILELSNVKRGFSEFITTNLTNDGIVVFVKVLRKVADCAFLDNKYKVLQIYLDEIFINKLKSYIVLLPMHEKRDYKLNRYFWNDPDDFWNNLIRISQDIYDTIPTFAPKVVPTILKSLIVCFPSFEAQHSRHISDEIKEKVNKLNEAVQILVKEYEEQEKTKLQKKVNSRNDEEPPDDFRQISLYPSSLELLSNDRGFLRENVVQGPYKDVNHYLDVQFRLLREDFVRPLRTGITAYRSESNKRIENVKIYKKVRFLNAETVNEQYCIRLQFDFTKKKKSFKYENSKRFMFGSLLCFTGDNFKSLLFGKVSNRDVKDLERGELIVGFDENVVVDYNKDYLMVECSVYFEPYYHVLNVLKNMSVDNFPMEKYIIHVDGSVQPPNYLTVPGCHYTIRGHEFSPLYNWPNKNFYHLNESQLEAFEAALTQEFCIIQGPPGTGKTFLGLKIAKTLLENEEVWYRKTPMLVICYTNHALDQFLEGLTQFTKRILRIGGQSKNDNLKQFNIRNASRFKMNPAVYQQRLEVKIILGKIKNVSENLKQMDLYDSVRAFDVFEDVVPNFSKTWFHRAKKHEILDWLLGETSDTSHLVGTRNPNTPQEEQQRQDGGSDESDQSEESDDDDYDIEDLEVQVDDIFEVETDAMLVQCSSPLITISSLRQNILTLQHTVEFLRTIENPTTQQLLEEDKSNFQLFELNNRFEILNRRLILDGKQKAMMRRQLPTNADLVNPHTMKPDDRWNLYFYWLDLYKAKLQEKLELLNKEFREAFKIYEEMRDIENTNSMKEVLVVGMTTTGAARLRSSLQALRSPVVIVEEAAEVLEAHIISALTKYCQHLILIGDHQQLKPSTASYSIERFYNLGISLFERMVINKIQLYTLNVQHRMKPEICSLIAPTIYPRLQNHPSVFERKPITGIDKCLYFIDHTHQEDNCEGTSKKNYHEVEFLIQLAKHLVLNGYKPENITILAAYLGQMFELQKEKKKYKHILENIRVAVLDNYQGEECDIILLSLVRSNNANKIGFLSIENRVCVALSRARDGFYLMGNMTQLCMESKLWQNIRHTLEDQAAIGTELELRCQVHPEKVTSVTNAADFLNIAEGGCEQKCGAALVCGHTCTSLCHVRNRDHIDYKCRETCGKRLCDANFRHVCTKMCYQECGPCIYLVSRALPCGHVVNLECYVDPDTYDCVVPVTTTLPCGHVADKPCHRNPDTYRCPHPCDIKVEPCGHACEMKCHVRQDPDHLEYKCKKKCARYRKDCTLETEDHVCRKFCYEECEPCLIRVRKKRTICPHVYDIACSENVDEIACEKPCTKILPCSHKCKGKCNEPCRKCEIKVDKIVPRCGHILKVKCCDEPDRKLCDKKCPLELPCGHPCTKKCNEPCTTDCKVTVPCRIYAQCGHLITEIKCSIATSISARQDEKRILKHCNHLCREELGCGHKCSGTCGKCSQGRFHQRCSEKCGFPLVCSHPCKFPCREACRPCSLPCPYKCKHSSCSRRCGDICTPCKEQCPRRCPHQKCTRVCGFICNVLPCQEVCPKKLKCGHPCVGFCGDPCPPQCMVCDKEELLEVFFGFEDEDARYVLLEDCGHIVESTGLEQWFKHEPDDKDEEISFKVCPKCKTPIKTTQRYSDYIKRAMADVAKVKKKLHGTVEENDKKRTELQRKLVILDTNVYSSTLSLLCPRLSVIYQTIKKRLEGTRGGKRQPINKSELNAIESKLQIIEHVVNICTKDNMISVNSSKEILSQVAFIMSALTRDEDYITDQEISDVHLELNRLSRILDFNKIKKSPHFAAHFSSTTRVKHAVAHIEELIFGLEKFTDETEELVKQLLKNLNKMVAAGIGISDKERREIVKAMGFKQGHWYKCPNGHPYAIGECGGAMQESICPEAGCGAKIGGTGHRLVSGNQVATEMDGAAHSAWSEAANMANYEL